MAACADAFVAQGGAASRAALAATAPKRCVALLVGYERDAAAVDSAVSTAVAAWCGAPPRQLTRASAALERGGGGE